eukprot:765949-Hanusia_phi.AAC.4
MFLWPELFMSGGSHSTISSGKRDEKPILSIAGGKTTLVPMTEETLRARQKHDEMLRKFQIEMRARTVAGAVFVLAAACAKREAGMVVLTLEPAERRDRLKIILARKEVEEGISANDIVSGNREDDDRDYRDGQVKETFYTEGPDELKAARLWIAEYSLPRAKSRTMIAKRKQVTYMSRESVDFACQFSMTELENYIARKETKLKEYEAAIKGVLQTAGTCRCDMYQINRGERNIGRRLGRHSHGRGTKMFLAHQARKLTSKQDNETEQEHNRFMDKAGKVAALPDGFCG